MFNIKNILSHLNRERKKKFSRGYVSKKKYDDLAQKYTTLVDAITSAKNPLKTQARLTHAIPIEEDFNDKELCLFVSYAATPHIKEHVAHHIQMLIKAGINVILIINTDNPESQIILDDWTKKLSGLFIRENIGYDFGAWSHAYSNLHENCLPSRLYLINDSMIGPLSESMFDGMLKKIRGSSADIIGLTANQDPIFHLQSFFLVFSRKIQKNKKFKDFFKSLWQLPSKDMVIDFYETRITRLIKSLGYSAEAIYKTNNSSIEKSDAVIHNLDALFLLNFPYIKTSMVNKPAGKKIIDKFSPKTIDADQEIKK